MFLEAVLSPRLGCVLVTNCCHHAELHRASEHVGGNVRTSGVIAEIFGEQLFAPVWSLEARLDRYLRNRESPHCVICVATPVAVLYLSPALFLFNIRLMSGANSASASTTTPTQA